MLASFTIPVAGATQPLLVEDIEACVFWQGYPDLAGDLSDRAKRQAEAAWLRHVLVRATRLPTLRLDDVMDMGNDYWPPTERYLEAVGFFPRPVLAPAMAAALREVVSYPRTQESADQRAAEFAAYRGCIPPVHVRRLLHVMARAISVPGSQLWTMPASEFFFCYHINLTDEEKAGAPLREVVT